MDVVHSRGSSASALYMDKRAYRSKLEKGFTGKVILGSWLAKCPPPADLQPTHYLADSALAPIMQSRLATGKLQYNCSVQQRIFPMASGQGMDRQRLGTLDSHKGQRTLPAVPFSGRSYLMALAHPNVECVRYPTVTIWDVYSLGKFGRWDIHHLHQ